MTQQHPITPSNLSPQAWAVLEAAYQAPDDGNATRQSVAAALRAAADQVVPWAPQPSPILGPVYVAQVEKQRKIRDELLAIAAELETSTTETDA
jgi:hypothetical protein